MRYTFLSVVPAIAAAAVSIFVPGCYGQIESTEPGHS